MAKGHSKFTTVKDGVKVMTNSNLHFGSLLKKNLDRVHHRVFVMNKAGMVLIDGGVGSGKTTLAVHCADYLNGSHIDFDLQLAMGGEDFQEKLRECYQRKLKVLIYDEAGDFNRRASLTRFNADLNRIFETYRVFKIIVILVLPSVEDLDDSIFKKEIPRYLLHCYARTLTTGRYMGYALNRVQWIKYYMKTTPNKTKAYVLEQHNIRESFTDLPPKRQQELTDYTVKGKLEILELKMSKKEAMLKLDDLVRLTGQSGLTIRGKLHRLGEFGERQQGNGNRKLYPASVIPYLQAIHE